MLFLFLNQRALLFSQEREKASSLQHNADVNHLLTCTRRCAGGLGAFVTAPLDLVKTRLQSTMALGWKQTAATAPVGGRTLHILRLVYRADGVRGLWRGFVPAASAVVPSRGIYFYLYHQNVAWLSARVRNADLVHVSAAFVAGCAVSSILAPVWVVKTRMQMQNQAAIIGTAHLAGRPAPREYGGMLDCMRHIVREEGVRGLFRGMTLSWLGSTEGAIHFLIFERFKAYARARDPSIDDRTVPPLAFFVYAAIARLFATTITYPHEVVRTRVRQREAGDAYGRGVVRAFRSVYAAEGLRGYYNGMAAHLLRVVPNAAIVFVSFEFFAKLFGGNKHQRM